MFHVKHIRKRGKIMAKTTQKHWYVLVCTGEGAKFVTGEGEHHTAYWDKDKVPKEFSKEYALDMTRGLCLNGYNAFAVCREWEQPNQPYAYYCGHFEWVNDEQKTE